jgi:uncharacterized protein DUF3310
MENFLTASQHLDSMEAVNHPEHYQLVPGVECIDVAENFGFNIGNAIKYLWRCDNKGNPITDLHKAVFYIKREIRRRNAAS